jgi:hypothetical protein
MTKACVPTGGFICSFPNNSGTFVLNYDSTVDGSTHGAIFKSNGDLVCSCTGCLGPNEEGSFWGYYADSNYVYALFVDSGVNLFRCPVNGGAAVMLVKDGSADTQCALVGTTAAIYWKSNPDGVVHRIAK